MVVALDRTSLRTQALVSVRLPIGAGPAIAVGRYLFQLRYPCKPAAVTAAAT